ncbi:Protein of unknown function [Bacillus cytotoxicus]|uniref:Uncharacterized protein n=1 Tax=Bacillus cytotoxicus TaxID=580165 RepID=A0AAX2CEQ9_9BACI|nr:Protein of unknown function [Bacillus cytotoxicus]SCN33535.1 Protein of unknown function [Bacillus cytotoxicus]
MNNWFLENGFAYQKAFATRVSSIVAEDREGMYEENKAV